MLDVWRTIVGWVQGLPRIHQIIVGAVASVFVQSLWSTGATVVAVVIGFFPAFTTGQLLITLTGVVIMQTFIQIRRFNRLNTRLETMTDFLRARADGGSDLPPRNEHGQFKSGTEGTSGGGALGGAIAGAAIGSSYGPGGALFGAVLWAIVGDELEDTSS